MAISDWIILLSAIIVTVGWFVTSRLDRKNDIAVVRSKYRMEAYEKWIDFFLCLQDNRKPEGFDFSKDPLRGKIIGLRLHILLYGQADEYELIGKLIVKMSDKNNKEDLAPIIDSIHRLVLDRIRIELGNSKMPLY